jgi:hypothetical protein
MSVVSRAKFRVTSVLATEGWGNGAHQVLSTITMVPVIANGRCEENEAFYAATPSGKIELAVLPKSTAEQFVVGREFYIDFLPVDHKPEEG